MKEPDHTPTELRRRLTLPMITLYGLGTTIGGGIYALVGKVAERAGLYAPISFVVAAVLAAFSALTFAELSSRFPKSAGEAVYVEEGFGSAWLAGAVGWLVVLVGAISAAALSNGFAGYLRVFLPVPAWLALVFIVIVLAAIAIWGIGESVTTAAVVTVVEIGGLVLVIWAGGGALASLPGRIDEFMPPFEFAAWAGIVGGSFLAYYAFVGFEDMVNVAEEVRDVRRVLPLAIVLTLAVTTALYLVVSVVAVAAVPLGELAASDAPLALVWQRGTGSSWPVISAIAVFALVNGALIQVIMAARVLYGMSRQGRLPAVVGRVDTRTQTPVFATVLVAALVLILALGFEIETLAQTTTLVILFVAVLVNGALLRIKLRGPAPAGSVTYPIWVPAGGLIVSVLFASLVVADFWGHAAAWLGAK
jgi:amino acid transporter